MKVSLQRLSLRRALLMTLAGLIGAILAGGLIVWLADRDQFRTPLEGFWWALATITTVGHGSVVPHSALGRLVGAALMLGAVVVFALSGAILASVIVIEEVEGKERAQLQAQTDELLARFDALEQSLLEQLRDRPTDD